MAHIIIIDDDTRIRTLVCKTLENEGHRVSVARDGKEGLRIFDGSVELVVSDVLMPRMSGLEMIDHLRKRSPSVSIISMSAGGQILPDDYLRVADVIGANRTIEKPFVDWELLEIINELLSEARATKGATV